MAAAVLNFSLQWGSERCFTGVLYWCSDILLNSLPPWGLLGAYRTFGLCLMRLITECSTSESCLLRLLFFHQERLFQFKKLHYTLPFQVLSFIPFHILRCLTNLGRDSTEIRYFVTIFKTDYLWLWCNNRHLLSGI